MKKKILFKLIFLFSIVLSSYSTFSQTSSFKQKVISTFTKKKQIQKLNIKVDSLNSVVLAKNNLLLAEVEKNTVLTNDFNLKCTSLNSVSTRVSELENELTKNKSSLDSLQKVITDNQDYSIFQRNEDSLRYQNLLRKLSDRNMFIVDSIKTIHNTRRTKQEPTKIETYYFKDFKSIITGTPDEKNRYTYTFELFQKSGEEYVKAENSALFNDKKQELLDLINKKIQKDFNSSYKIDPKCFTSKTPPTYDFKKLGIEFKDGKINFYAVFDFTTENCYYLYGYTSVEFTVDELKAYLK